MGIGTDKGFVEDVDALTADEVVETVVSKGGGLCQDTTDIDISSMASMSSKLLGGM